LEEENGVHVILAGGGIGGLTAALALRQRGMEVTVFEAAPEIRALGVGINLLPHAVGMLSKLGLFEALDATAIRARELLFMNRHGQAILADARGIDAGYEFPQFSIHRGELQMILLEAATKALGPSGVRCGYRLASFETRGERVQARFTGQDGSPAGAFEGDVLIGADGIHSAARAFFYPDEGMPLWNGIKMWRGVTEGVPFLGGRTQVWAGWRNQKFVSYPISRKHADSGRALINWICDLRQDDTQMLRREDWNRPGHLPDFLPRFEHWKFPFLDVPTVIRGASSIFEFPMVDRDPLPRWSHGRVTLLGDAAHPMYPIGSNGASQAVLDAMQVAESLATLPDPVQALQHYESLRLPMTADIVRANRKQGLDAILDLVEERAPDGFTDLDSVIPKAELADIVGRYKAMAGHQQKRQPAAR
jgi:2-polyprenyl-6-methoxyphenol hydroxylase-like FAD-dependent oxidoreductase